MLTIGLISNNLRPYGFIISSSFNCEGPSRVMKLSSNFIFQFIKCWRAAGLVAAASLCQSSGSAEATRLIKSQDKSSRHAVLTPSHKKKVVGGLCHFWSISSLLFLWGLLRNDGKTTSQAVSTASLHPADCTGRNNWCVRL